MKKTIPIQRSTFHISWRRMIFASVILSFVFPSILLAEIQNGSFEFDGRTRNYMVYLPTNYTGSTNFPLVICLHPYGWGAERMMNYTNFNQVADAYDFIVVYPSAIPNWNSGVADNPEYPTPNVDDVGFINALIDIMSNSYSIDLERVYACGYSNGGFMSYKLACQLSNRIAAIASVGAVISTSTAESCSPLRTVPVLHIFGTADPYVPINGGMSWYSADQTLSYWINFNDCLQIDTTILPDLDPTDGCTVEKITYTNCSENCDVVYYKVINGGHTWPGAGPLHTAFGKTNQDINASVEIWNFFTKHKLVTSLVDLNSDGIVDALDLCIMIDHWNTDDPLCDIAPQPDGDGIVDVQDLILLAEHLFEEIFPPELVAYWKLDEEQGDVAYNSTRNNHGITSGDPTWKPDSGQVAGALELDGINDYVQTGFVLNPAEGSFSVFAWIQGGASGQVIISQADIEGQSATESGSTWLGISQSDGRLMTGLMAIFFGSLESEFVVADEQWHHVGLVYDYTTMKRHLYVDGAQVAVDSGFVGGVQSTAGLYIGAGQTLDEAGFFSGLIDDVRIYNRVVSP